MVLVCILIVSCASLLAVKPVDAQTIPKPSVPEFFVRYADYSFDVAPIYGIDQFTGQQTIIKNGYRVDNETFEFQIKNQPFTQYIDSYGHTISLHYNLRFKGSYGTEWLYFPYLDNLQGVRRFAAGIYQLYDPDLPASNSSYTTLSVNVAPMFYDSGKPPLGSKVEFQVQALIGFISYPGDGFYDFAGQKSDWSPTQETIVSSINSSPFPMPTATPIVPELSPSPVPSVTDSLPNNGPTSPPKSNFDLTITFALVAVVIIASLAVVLLLKHRKAKA